MIYGVKCFLKINKDSICLCKCKFRLDFGWLVCLYEQTVFKNLSSCVDKQVHKLRQFICTVVVLKFVCHVLTSDDLSVWDDLSIQTICKTFFCVKTAIYDSHMTNVWQVLYFQLLYLQCTSQSARHLFKNTANNIVIAVTNYQKYLLILQVHMVHQGATLGDLILGVHHSQAIQQPPWVGVMVAPLLELTQLCGTGL